jgi:hypothetical protein
MLASWSPPNRRGNGYYAPFQIARMGYGRELQESDLELHIEGLLERHYVHMTIDPTRRILVVLVLVTVRPPGSGRS